jgi:starvation-inducible DNA-binding protein
MQNSANTLPAPIRSRSVALLNRHLAAAIDLRGQIRQAHWNVRGPAFVGIRELFDHVAGVIEEYSDKIAKRADTLGGAVGGTGQTATRSFLEPYRVGIADPPAHMGALTEALASFSDSLHSAIDESDALGDQDTSELFSEVSRGIDYELWLVESHRPPRRNVISAFQYADLSRTNSWRRPSRSRSPRQSSLSN